MSEINWEKINCLLEEIEKWQEDIGYVRDCSEELAAHIPTLIERIQKLAKEKNELRKENEKLKKQLLNSMPNFGGLNIKIDPNKLRTWNGPGVGMHTILPFQTYEPKFTPIGKNPYPNFDDNTIWSNSAYRDSM